jgi:hypothetical protein
LYLFSLFRACLQKHELPYAGPNKP